MLRNALDADDLLDDDDDDDDNDDDDDDEDENLRENNSSQDNSIAGDGRLLMTHFFEHIHFMIIHEYCDEKNIYAILFDCD